MSATVNQAAERLRDAQHVVREVGGRAAQAELTRARAALKDAVRPSRQQP